MKQEDKVIIQNERALQKWMPLIAGSMFMILIGLSIFSWLYFSTANTAAIIESDLKMLVDAFEKIDQDCRILNFDHVTNQIDFLNVGSFSGSEVGSLNMAFPMNWKGPYLKDNPTLQTYQYIVVSTDQGYFIVPGLGVTLPNGKIIGKDIIFDKKTDVLNMMKSGGSLFYNNKPLAARLKLHASLTERILSEKTLDVEE